MSVRRDNARRVIEDLDQLCACGRAKWWVDPRSGEVQCRWCAALARFEHLTLTQRPATQPWTPVTDYSLEARAVAEGRHPDLIVATLEPTRLLDYGCGPHYRLATLLHQRGVNVAAYDPQIAGSECVLQRPDYDVVVCREVLEHCTVLEIRRIVAELCRLSTRFVYVTTRFAKEPTSLLDVDTSDDLDPTHITMLNQHFLRVLFVLEGFKRRADLEQRLDWQKKGRCLVYERV